MEKEAKPSSKETSQHSSPLVSQASLLRHPSLTYADVLRRARQPASILRPEVWPLTEETSPDSSPIEDNPDEDTRPPPSIEEDDSPQILDQGFSIEESYPKDKNSYQILGQICQGARSLVCKALCIPLNTFVAIKIINLQGSDSKPDLDAIQAINDSLPVHPNILKPYCCFADESQLWLVMPYVAGGSLQSIIAHDYTDGLPLKCIAMVLETVLNVLVLIHGHGYPHRGVKAGNILLDFNGEIGLSDFGMSASNWEADPMVDLPEISSSVTPPYWVPPEAISSESQFTLKSDIWCFGITAMELFYGRPPISSKTPNPKHMLMKIAKRFQYAGHYESGKGRGDRKAPNSLRNLVESCLEIDHVKRPDAEDLLKHPFFSSCKAKGPSYLIGSVMASLPNVERRLRLTNIPKPVFSSNADRRKLVGWVFNKDEFELKPIYTGAMTEKNKPEDDKSNEAISKVCSGQILNPGMAADALLALGKVLTHQICDLDRLLVLYSEQIDKASKEENSTDKDDEGGQSTDAAGKEEQSMDKAAEEKHSIDAAGEEEKSMDKAAEEELSTDEADEDDEVMKLTMSADVDSALGG